MAKVKYRDLGKSFSKWSSRPELGHHLELVRDADFLARRCIESETLEEELRSLCFNKPSRRF